jgi:hypothetical protein
MAHTEHNLEDLLTRNTISFKNVPDMNGEKTNPDGSPRNWIVTPLTVDREREVEMARLKNTDYLQRVIAYNSRRWTNVQEGRDPDKDADEQPQVTEEEELDPMVTAEKYAPIVAAMVSNVKLDPEELIANFPGILLAYVAEEVTSFFQEVNKRMKETRADRRR